MRRFLQLLATSAYALTFAATSTVAVELTGARAAGVEPATNGSHQAEQLYAHGFNALYAIIAWGMHLLVAIIGYRRWSSVQPGRWLLASAAAGVVACLGWRGLRSWSELLEDSAVPAAYEAVVILVTVACSVCSFEVVRRCMPVHHPGGMPPASARPGGDVLDPS